MDEDVVEIGNVESVCRLCLSTDETRSSVFATQGHEDSSGVSLTTKIEACLSIQISSTDKLSTLICANCVKRVNQWHTYKESCLRSQNKLQQWLASQLQSNPTVVTIKDEPMDLDYKDEDIVLEGTSDSEEAPPVDQTLESTDVNEEVQQIDETDASDENAQKDIETVPSAMEDEKESVQEEEQVDQQNSEILHTIKSEPQDDDDTDCTIDLEESMDDSDLLLNPMAVTSSEETIMEADSTQKSNATGVSPKKKFKRGPHTHFRGARVFKKKCVHCQIFLHSKYTYLKHMKRFHSKENGENSESMSQNDEEEEMIEDIEDELISMEKESPLTQVQQDIISQLKTFSCYTCDQTFNDRRSTLSHIRQHLPDLRPYTCIACLTEFPDRSMYQLHCGASFECAMKIALVVPKHGSERYFTCNMCLRSMPGRKELLSHLSKHSDKQYEEMMSPMRSPPKLKPMTPLPSTENDVSANAQKSLAGPYKNGDPAHNHICDLCGMIYRYRPNMYKHREFCRQLQPEARTSYKCVHCRMTFLVFKKFHSHITVAHKKKEFHCSMCSAKFLSPSDYLTHHEKHRASAHNNRQIQHDGTSSQNIAETGNAHEADVKFVKSRIGIQKYSCALCGQEFSTRTELTEHRNLHLKVKIYSCIICRSMFSSPSALEIHMKDHGIEDPNERNANISCVEYGSLDEDARIEDLMEDDVINASATSDPGSEIHECNECGRVLSNYANLRRHTKMVHRNATIYDCNMCSRMFTCKELYDHHMQIQHNSSKTMLQCPQCPKSFVFHSNFNYHFRTAHLEKSNGYPCDICGKVFVEGASLKIHRGWHNRANSRLSTRFILGDQKSANADVKETVDADVATNSERPARARKSFPNPPSQSSGTKSSGNFQCQVCNDKFNDVNELRNHLWDVHCARNKPEKSFSNNELQCELCTNVFPDQETLASHMQWHRANPILSDIRKTFSCDVCGKSYSSRKVLWKHKKLHKATVVASYKFQSLARKPMATQFMCTFCRKVFSSSQSLQRHKLSFHSEPQNQQHVQSQSYNNTRKMLGSHEDEPRIKRMKVEIDDDNSSAPKLPPFATDYVGEKRKPVMCHVCQKMFPNMSVLYRHRQIAHKQRIKKDATPECIPMATRDGKFSCNVCYKVFPGLSNLRQHFTIKHKKTFQHNTSSDDRSVLLNAESPKDRETNYNNNVMYSCKLCKQCHVFNKQSIISHVTNMHNAVYQADRQTFHREVDLGAYMVHGAVGTTCPLCNVKYPNNRALKIHYIKFHDSPDQ